MGAIHTPQHYPLTINLLNLESVWEDNEIRHLKEKMNFSKRQELFSQTDGIPIPGEGTVYRVMEEIGLSYKSKRKLNGITKADKEARKSDGLIKRGFTAEKPLEKCVSDMMEIGVSDRKLYISAIFGCYGLAELGLAMDTDMMCEQTLDNAVKAYPMFCGAVLHNNRGIQYTSELYRKAINKYGIRQSMNCAGVRGCLT